MKKLTRREAALIRWAKKEAVEQYKAKTWIRVVVNYDILTLLSIQHLEWIHRANGTGADNTLTIDYGSPITGPLASQLTIE